MIRLSFLVFLAVTVFAASFYAAQSVQAHGTHCGTYAPKFCDRYYSAQYRCCSYGIQGKIKGADVTLVSPSTDYTAHWVGITSLDVTEWVQMGFTEGIDPDGGIPSYPELYTEFQRWACGYAYDYDGHGTPGGIWDQMIIYYTGISSTCPSNPGVILYRFEMRRGSLSGPVLATADLGSPWGRFDAESERGNWHAIEPNGKDCFGTNSACSASTTYGLKARENNGQWVLWPASPPPPGSQDYPYTQVVTAPYYSFYTIGGP